MSARGSDRTRVRRFAGRSHIRTSTERSVNARCWLPSLQKAERFYKVNCWMQRVGPDPDDYDLVYFEYPDGAATAWLAAARNVG